MVQKTPHAENDQNNPGRMGLKEFRIRVLTQDLSKSCGIEV